MKSYHKTENCALYQCDNLELMKSLPDNYIDLIYCDILYGTGKNFGDYQDLKLDKKIIEEHYAPRLNEMHRILKNTGSIYIQMDCKISHWIRIILDDVFDYENLQNEIIWSYHSGGRSKKRFGRKHDTIFFYSKEKKYTFNTDDIRLPFTPHKQDISGKNYGGRMGFDEDGREYVEKWGTGKKKLYRYYLDEGKLPEDVWTDIQSIQSTATERVDYPTQKPKLLLERIIKASSNKNDIVADFYMGSGTTGEVALELGRKFIGCDIGDKACRIAKERLEKII